MTFNKAIQLDRLKSLVSELNDNINSFCEYGHVTIPTEEVKNLKKRSDILIVNIESINKELDKFSDEMTEWYGY